MNYLITCNENSQGLLIDEIKRHKGLGTISWLSETEAILESKLTNEKLVEVIRTTPIIFIRHLFPILGEVAYDDAATIYETLTLDKEQSFSFQIRSPQELRKEATDLRNKNVDALIEAGYTLDVKDPEQIVSLYFFEKTVYVGVGTADLQLSKWSAGMVHYSKFQSQISRAEFKLREVFESFEVPKTKGIAVDLGAAPGGWTQVLVEQGFNVIAVDPAKLDPKLKSNPQVRHVKTSAQEYLSAEPGQKFDVIVNDMKMTVKSSVTLLHSYSQNMNKGGFGVITLKLPKEYNYDYIATLINFVRKYFVVDQARQLFHNRHEITVLVSKK